MQLFVLLTWRASVCMKRCTLHNWNIAREQSIYRLEGVILPGRMLVPLKTASYLVVECGNTYQIQIHTRSYSYASQYVLLAILNCALSHFYVRIWFFFVFLSLCRWKLKRVLLCRFIYGDWFLMCANKKQIFVLQFCRRRKSFLSLYDWIFWWQLILCYVC